MMNMMMMRMEQLEDLFRIVSEILSTENKDGWHVASEDDGGAEDYNGDGGGYDFIFYPPSLYVR